MNNVLVVASHIPPYHQGQVMRVAKLIKYLPEFNWDSVLLSAEVEQGMETITDLAGEVRKSKKIYRAKYVNLVKIYHTIKGWFSSRRTNRGNGSSGSTERQAGAAVGSSLAARYLVPDYYFTWIPFAVVCGIKALLCNKIDVIYSMSPLPSNLAVGYVLHKLSGKPWVADLRDPWTTNPIAAKRAHRLIDALDVRLERLFLKACSKIVVINDQFIAPLLVQHPMVDRSKFLVVPNGYDPDDFKGVESMNFDKFTVVHSGKFYENRSPEPFLNALDQLLDRDPVLRAALQVKLIGASDARTVQAVKQLGLGDVVELIEFVPHKVSLQYILSADCLLLIPGPGESTMTGKIFEYLAAGKPILALAGKGAAGDLVSSTHTGIVVAPDDVHGIADALLSLCKAASSNGSITPYRTADHEVRKQFDRREIARKVATLLDSLVANR